MKTLYSKRELWAGITVVSKETMDTMLRHLLFYRVDAGKTAPLFFPLRFNNIASWHSFNMKNQFTHIHPLGSAWCLLQTQYAKKPKNPV